MPNPYFLPFELVVLVGFGLCLRHAARAGLPEVCALLAGVVFGLLLELATIRQLHAYRYGHFTLMVLDVPLMIGVGWGSIIYGARLVSDATSLPEWARPVLDAMLGLNIDLAMDAIAIRLGMWDWGQGLDVQYFGVPWANFWAWFWVIASFSTGLRLLRHAGRLGAWLAPLGALVVGLVGVMATNALIAFHVPRAWHGITVAATLGAGVLLLAVLRPQRRVVPDPVAGWVPLLFHGYVLAAGLASGVVWHPPVLLVVSVAMLAASLWIHRGVPLPRGRPVSFSDPSGALAGSD